MIAGQAGNDGSVEMPGVFVIRNQYLDPVGAFCRHREEGTHQSGADSSGGMGDVEFQDEVEMFDQVGCDGKKADTEDTVSPCTPSEDLEDLERNRRNDSDEGAAERLSSMTNGRPTPTIT